MNETENIEVWLEVAATKGASDLHIVPGHKPTLRLHGQLVDLDAPVLEPEFVRTGLLQLCDDDVREKFESENKYRLRAATRTNARAAAIPSQLLCHR